MGQDCSKEGGMMDFHDLPFDVKRKIVLTWKAMNDKDKEHFTNQVALVLSVFGEKKGVSIVVDTLRQMMEDGTKNLADFGIYVIKNFDHKRDKKAREAALMMEIYRTKNELPMEPHISLF
jgi:hypothetical protein